MKATLDGRTSKKLSNHAHPDAYRKGTAVSITCQAYGGETYKGSYLWDKTTKGHWIADYYLKTGSSGPVIGLPRCDLDSPIGAAGGRLRPVDLKVSAAGAGFVAAYEGFRATPYHDAGGHCTIGYGHLIHRGNCTSNDYKAWGTLSRDAALGLLWTELNTFASGIRSTLPNAPMRQGEFDALVSFSYNIGLGGFRSSQVRKDLSKATPDYKAVPKHMLSWVYSGKTPLCGLYKRRVNEGELFGSSSYKINVPKCPY